MRSGTPIPGAYAGGGWAENVIDITDMRFSHAKIK